MAGKCALGSFSFPIRSPHLECVYLDIACQTESPFTLTWAPVHKSFMWVAPGYHLLLGAISFGRSQDSLHLRLSSLSSREFGHMSRGMLHLPPFYYCQTHCSTYLDSSWSLNSQVPTLLTGTKQSREHQAELLASTGVDKDLRLGWRRDQDKSTWAHSPAGEELSQYNSAAILAQLQLGPSCLHLGKPFLLEVLATNCWSKSCFSRWCSGHYVS